MGLSAICFSHKCLLIRDISGRSEGTVQSISTVVLKEYLIKYIGDTGLPYISALLSGFDR